MRRWMLTAPRWVLAVVLGLPFGAAMAIFRAVTGDRSWTQALVGGAIAGVVYGGLMAPVTHRRNEQARQALGDLSASDTRRAVRATRRGPVPEDSVIRVAAYRLAGHHLDQLRRWRGLTIVVFGVALVLGVVLAVTQTAWFWAAAALFAGMLGWSMVLPRRLERRAELLRWNG